MFNVRLRMLRKEKGLTQIQLSEKTNIGNKTISDYERGVSSPDLETLNILSNFFNVSIDYLLGLTDDKNRVSLNKQKLSDVKLAFYNQAEEITDEQAEEVLGFINYIKERDKK